MEIGTILTPVLEAAVKEVSKLSSIKKFAKRTVNHITKGELIMPVFGAAGVGKTTFARLMQGVNPLELGDIYDESIFVENHKIKKDHPLLISVSVGQGRKGLYMRLPILLKMEEARRFGVINIVTYGYNTYTNARLNDNISKEQFLIDYRRRMLNNEIASLGGIIGNIGNMKKKNSFFVTIIAKQDLWYDKREEVLNYYQNGEYNEIIMQLEKIGIPHYFMTTAFNLANFKSPSGEILTETVKGYDFSTYLRYNAKLFKDLDALCRGE